MDASQCPGCSSTLLVDVIPADRPADGKSRYQLARSLAAIPGAPPLPALRSALEKEGVPLVRGVTRAAAAAFDTALSGHGILALLQPVAPAPARPSLRRLALVAAAAGLAVLATIVVVRAMRPTRRAQAGAGTITAALADPTKSIVAMRCQGNDGATGFFIQPRRILFPAHGLCLGDGPLFVLQDHRSLESRIVGRDTRLDLAVLDVDEGADVQPFPVGDATALKPGDRLQVLGTALGQWHAWGATVVSVGTPDKGVGWLTLDSVGGDGGPVLDSQGRVVGIVARSVQDERTGRAVPINYAFDASQTAGVPLLQASASPMDEDRWRDYLRRAGDDEDARARTFIESVERQPAVLEATSFRNDILEITLLQRSLQRPDPPEMGFDVRLNGTSICSGTMRLSEIYTAKDHDRLLRHSESGMRWSWLNKHRLLDDVYLMRFNAQGSFQACVTGRPHLTVHVKGATPDFEAVPLHLDTR